MGYEFNLGHGYLRFDAFRKLVDDLPQFDQINLDNIGELFLNPDILEIIAYAQEKHIPIGCSTGVNLNHVSDQVLEGLVKYGFQNLTCSIDGATPETYAVYRVGGAFEKVIGHIKTINGYKEKYNSELPRLTWQFIVFGHNEHELPLARKMAQELGMDFYPKTAWDATYSPIRDQGFVLNHTGWLAATREDHERVTGKKFARGTCHSLWHSPRINWDGRVVGCCWNTWSDFGGNVLEQGYVVAVDSEQMKYAKEMLQGKAGARNDIPCHQCEMYLDMKRTDTFLTEKEIFSTLSPWYRALRVVYRGLGLNKLKMKESLFRVIYAAKYKKLCRDRHV